MNLHQNAIFYRIWCRCSVYPLKKCTIQVIFEENGAEGKVPYDETYYFQVIQSRHVGQMKSDMILQIR